MKTINLLVFLFFLTGAVNFVAMANSRLVSEKTHIRFFSSTPAEDIEANNYSATSTINYGNGNVAFSVPMQGFEFEKRLMQRHFNQESFLDTKEHPTARLVGRIANLDEVDFTVDGNYDAVIEGELTIKGVTKTIREKGTVSVNGSSVSAKSVFIVTLADHGIEFVQGKPASNIAKTVEVSVHAEYQSQ